MSNWLPLVQALGHYYSWRQSAISYPGRGKKVDQFIARPQAAGDDGVILSFHRPGVYRLRSETSVAQLIPMAGGFTQWANEKKILIIRNENGREKRITVNYRKIIRGSDQDSNVILKSGDTIIVP